MGPKASPSTGGSCVSPIHGGSPSSVPKPKSSGRSGMGPKASPSTGGSCVSPIHGGSPSSVVSGARISFANSSHHHCKRLWSNSSGKAMAWSPTLSLFVAETPSMGSVDTTFSRNPEKVKLASSFGRACSTSSVDPLSRTSAKSTSSSLKVVVVVVLPELEVPFSLDVCTSEGTACSVHAILRDPPHAFCEIAPFGRFNGRSRWRHFHQAMWDGLHTGPGGECASERDRECVRKRERRESERECARKRERERQIERDRERQRESECQKLGSSFILLGTIHLEPSTFQSVLQANSSSDQSHISTARSHQSHVRHCIDNATWTTPIVCMCILIKPICRRLDGKSKLTWRIGAHFQ